MIDDRGQRRRLAGAGGAGDEYEPAVLLGEPPYAGRQGEVGEVRDVARDHAEGHGDRAALPEAVDAEARQALGRVGAVELSGLEERLQALGRLGADLFEGELEIALTHLRLAFELAEQAIPTDDRRPVDLEVNVAGA